MQLLPGSKPFPIFTIFLPFLSLPERFFFTFAACASGSPVKSWEESLRRSSTSRKSKSRRHSWRSSGKCQQDHPPKKQVSFARIMGIPWFSKDLDKIRGNTKWQAWPPCFWKDLDIFDFLKTFMVLIASGQWTPGRHPQTDFDLCEKWFIRCHQTFFDSRFKIVKLQNRAIHKVTKGLILFAFPLEVTNNPLEI